MSPETFITEDFLLQTDAARELYHNYAEHLPIIDYHCHLPPEQIADDHRFSNLAEIWLHGDHYKWRLMRANGIGEKFCTGHAPDWQKFLKWAETVPKTIRNPLYHWTHLELQRYFGLTALLNPDTAKHIWDACNAKLAQPEFSCRGLMKMMNVLLVCTTDDPCDTLEHHRRIAQDPSFNIQVLPTWRPDKGMAVESPDLFNAWLDKLAAAADTHIKDLDTYLAALRKRHDHFGALGCRLSDHGIETAYAADYTTSEINAVFHKIRSGKALDPEAVEKFKSAMLYEFALMDAEKNWTQQFHFGALRNVNTRMMQQLGPNTGFDTISDLPLARPLARLLDRLDRKNKLPKTILYNLNPRDNELLAAMTGNFQDGSIPGKIQFGSAWWFLDQADGMQKQIAALSNTGLLSRFVGMLTDSRSFLSYPRHEYFRRLLCNILGTDIHAGLLPRDMRLIGSTVKDICYNNAATYFGFDLDNAPSPLFFTTKNTKNGKRHS